MLWGSVDVLASRHTALARALGAQGDLAGAGPPWFMIHYCPMSLDVNAMVRQADTEDSECIPCGTCVDNCSKGAIGFSFSAG